LHFGEEPKWNPDVKIIQVDISLEELGKNKADPALGIVGDINVVTSQLSAALQGWRYDTSSDYIKALASSAAKNSAIAANVAKVDKIPMTYGKIFDVIKETLHNLSRPEDGGIVYVSEGSNTMDISRSVFPVEHPRLRLDAGTYATMGVGLAYAIAAHCAYNLPEPEAASGPKPSRKKIVCLEGDSAFGFSMAEVETMARYGIDALVFVVNNNGVYDGDSPDSDTWRQRQQNTIEGNQVGGLRSSSLGWEVGYEKVAEMCGGKGYLVRTPAELAKATEEGFNAKVPVVINVIIETGQAQKLVSFFIDFKLFQQERHYTKSFWCNSSVLKRLLPGRTIQKRQRKREQNCKSSEKWRRGFCQTDTVSRRARSRSCMQYGPVETQVHEHTGLYEIAKGSTHVSR
jgi:2-hydroxyacyl-CoA lyase 1